jgi:hypothetical protein
MRSLIIWQFIFRPSMSKGGNQLNSKNLNIKDSLKY